MRALRVTAVLLLALLTTALAPGPGPGAASAAERGARLRAGHFATDAGELQLLVDGRPVGGPLRYGDVTDYLEVGAGPSTVGFRPVGAGPDAAPLAATAVELAPGEAGSVLAAGAGDAVEAKAFRDDLSSPPAGQARLRLIHLAPGVPGVDARVRSGVRLFEDAVYGQTSSYVDVPEGAYDLEMLRAGTEQVLLAVRGVTVDGGSVYTMIGAGGGSEPVEVRGVLDAGGVGRNPSGGVPAGSGGAAPGGPVPASGARGLPATLAVLALLGAAGALAVELRAVAAGAAAGALRAQRRSAR